MQLSHWDLFFLNLISVIMRVLSLPSHAQAPKLQPVEYDKPPNYLEGGRQLALTCSGPIGDQRGQLVWELVYKKSTVLWSVVDDQKNLVMRPPSKSVYGISIGHAKRVESKTSAPGYSIESTLNVQVSSAINNSRLSCLVVSKFANGSSDSVNGSKALRSNTKIYFKVVFLPRRPNLKVNIVHVSVNLVYDHKSVCRAKCFAHVGHEGLIVWTLVNASKVLRWTFDLKKNMHHSKSAASLTLKFNGTTAFGDRDFGPAIMSNLELDLRPVVDKSILACYSYNVTDAHVLENKNDPLRTSYRIRVSNDADANPRRSLLKDILLYAGIGWAVIFICILSTARKKKDSGLDEGGITPDSSRGTSWSPMETVKNSRRSSIFSFRTVLSFFRHSSSVASSVGSQADDRSLHSRRRIHFSHRLS